MANQGFVQTLNLAEITDGAQIIQNLAGGTVDADLRVFAGLSSEKSQLFWNRFLNKSAIDRSGASLKSAVKFIWDTQYTYTDDDYVDITPINFIKDFAATYVGFNSDGALLNNTAGVDIVYDRGENYIEGTYTNLALQGGSGSGATATIIVNEIGEVSSVQIANNGSGYQQNDLVNATIPGGTGFAIRIVGFPWKVVVVGNYSWNVSALDTKNLSITIANTTNALNGTYEIGKTGGINTWGLPNNQTTKSYDVNRRIAAQEKITNNISLYDITGDGALTQYDVEMLNEFYNNNRDQNWFINYVNSNPTPAGSSRNTGQRIYLYLTGLDPNVFDVDSTGEFSFDYNLLTEYVSNGGVLYQRPNAASLVSSSEVTSTSIRHAISVSARVGRNPNYTVPTTVDELYLKPYFILYSEESGQILNYFDNFFKYGTKQTCTTTLNDYLTTSIGIVKTTNGIKYRISDKYEINGVYYISIVAAGTGFPFNQPFATNPRLTAISSTPVFTASSEYGVFDSNGSNEFYLRTNPRSSIESVKEIILFSDDYTLPSSETDVYSTVPTLTIIPDLVFKRDDSLTLENVQNLEIPVISDSGDNLFTGTGAFSYGLTQGYSGELANVTDNVDESFYLRSTKYRIDRNLYYQQEIRIEGFVTAFDPDALNITQTDLLLDNSPGIYISNSLSQITNTLAADFAQKTRSFSSDYNPWQADPNNQQLVTSSLNVTINDLVFTNEIGLDLGNYQGTSRYKGGNTALNETLEDNFNPTLLSQGKSFKLKITINDEDYYLIMRKP